MIHVWTLRHLLAMVARGLCFAMQLGAMMCTWKLLERGNGLISA
jgi:hypothetical protein